jgi:hypothetical protein
LQLASRARLLEDSFTIARAGLLPFGQVLGLSEYLVRETEYLPFLVFNNHLQMSYLLLRNHPKTNLLKAFHLIFFDNLFVPMINVQEFIVQMLEPFFKLIFSSTGVLQADISEWVISNIPPISIPK